MPLYHRHFEPSQLQFITTSTYRPAPIFSNPDYCPLFAQDLRADCSKVHFRLIGWVLMPEHFHVLLQPAFVQPTSDFAKNVKQRRAFTILEALRARRGGNR